MRHEQYFRIGQFVTRHCALLFFIHACGTVIVMETGADWLEPLDIAWFWGPFVAAFLMPRDYSYSEWVRERAIWFFFGGWLLTITLIPWLIWPFLYTLNSKLLHPVRDLYGRKLGLGGQTGFVIAICIVLGLVALTHECVMYRRKRT